MVLIKRGLGEIPKCSSRWGQNIREGSEFAKRLEMIIKRRKEQRQVVMKRIAEYIQKNIFCLEK